MAQTGQNSPQAGDAAAATKVPEIIVTAEKRSQSLQRTPVAVTALTSATIEQANISQPERLQFSVPSMTFGNDNGWTYLTLRGIGNDILTTAAESSVATYLDGVYTGNLLSESVPTYDLARIEVLRGPQGTLYGRNTIGGVINYITKGPSFSPGGEFAVSYGNYNAAQADLGLTGPILPDVAGRIDLHWSNHGGYRINLATGGHDYAHRDLGGRAELLFRLPHGVTFTLRGDYSSDRSTDTFGIIETTPLDGITGPTAPLGLFSLNAAQLAARGGILSPSDIAKLGGGSIASYYGLLQPGSVPPDPLRTLAVSNPVPSVYRTKVGGVSGTFEADLGPAHIKSISAYRYSSLDSQSAPGGVDPATVIFYPQQQSDRQVTEEINVSGDSFGKRFQWLVGAFYYHDGGHYDNNVFLPSYTDVTNATLSLSNPPGSPYAYNLNPTSLVNFNDLVSPNVLSTVLVSHADFATGQPLIANVSIPRDAFLGYLTDQNSTSVSGFAQGTLKLLDRLRFTGGFRYTVDDKDVVRSDHSNLIYALTALAGFPGAGLCDRVRTAKEWQAPTGTVGLDFDIAPRVLGYAKASWGYKAGGMNPPSCTGAFNPEYLASKEIGVKSILLDGQLLFNAAAYYYNYSSIQFTTYVANSALILNAGSATAYGVEAEYVVRPSLLRGFDLDGSMSFEHSEYGKGCFSDPAGLAGPIPVGANGLPSTNCPAGVAAYAQIGGNELVRAPQWKFNVGAQYTMDLQSMGNVLGRVEVAYTSTIYNDIFNGKALYESDVTQPGYTIVNARLVWTSLDGRYSAMVFGDNLTNALYATDRTAFNTPSTVVNVTGQFGAPRTYGVRFIAKLGSAH